MTVLLDLLCGVAHKWEEIAAYLPNLKQKSLSVVKAQQGEVDKKLFEIIKRWLNETHPPPTLKDLVEALRSDFISENRIADEVEKKFSTSK